MGMARYLVEAHPLEGRPVAELAKAHGVHRSWVYKLLARYRAEREASFRPRSRRPRRSPTHIPERFAREIIELREQLEAEGFDAGRSYRAGKVLLEYELERLGVQFKNSRPYHPQTLGKVELHQTLKRYLAKQQPAQTLSELQGQLDAFLHSYNHMCRHRALQRRTPLQAYSSRLKARPAGASAGTYFRAREDRIDKAGKVSLRYDRRLYKTGVGRAHKGRTVKLLIADLNVRVIDANGELLRELTLHPTRNYQPLTEGLVSPMSCDITKRRGRDSNPRQRKTP